MNKYSEQLTFDISDLQQIKPSDGLAEFDNLFVANMGDPTAALYVAFPKAENPELGTIRPVYMLEGYVVNSQTGMLDTDQPVVSFDRAWLTTLVPGQFKQLNGYLIEYTGKEYIAYLPDSSAQSTKPTGYVIDRTSGRMLIDDEYVREADRFSSTNLATLKQLKQGEIIAINGITVLCTGEDTGQSGGRYFACSTEDKFLLGQGTFGKVYKGFAIDPDSGIISENQPVAIKIQHIDNSNPLQKSHEQKLILREYLLSRHYQKTEMPVFRDPPAGEDQKFAHAFCVSEFFPAKELAKFITEGDIDRLDLSTLERFELILQIVLASHLFEYETPTTGPALIHHDMKEENILVRIGEGDPDHRAIDAYVIDYGLADYEDIDHPSAPNDKGTPLRMAPEIANGGVTTCLDTYPFAAIFARILKAADPARDKRAMWPAFTQDRDSLPLLLAIPYAIDDIDISEPGETHAKLQQLTLDFLQQMQNDDPRRRPSRDAILEFFTAAVHHLRALKIKKRVNELQANSRRTAAEETELNSFISPQSTPFHFYISRTGKRSLGLLFGVLTIIAVPLLILGFAAAFGDPLSINIASSAFHWLSSIGIISKAAAMADFLLGISITAVATLAAELIIPVGVYYIRKMLSDKQTQDDTQAHVKAIQNDPIMLLAKMEQIVLNNQSKPLAPLMNQTSDQDDVSDEEQDSIEDLNEQLDQHVNELFKRVMQKKGGQADHSALLAGHAASPVGTGLTSLTQKQQLPPYSAKSLAVVGSEEESLDGNVYSDNSSSSCSGSN